MVIIPFLSFYLENISKLEVYFVGGYIHLFLSFNNFQQMNVHFHSEIFFLCSFIFYFYNIIK